MAGAPRPDAQPDSRPPRSSAVMARLTLSAVEQLVAEPGGWREPMVHRALLVSGLSVLLSSLAVVQGQNSMPG
ncbi:MAG: hypothetical protein ACO3FA_11120 [Vulcanococcus sp.]